MPNMIEEEQLDFIGELLGDAPKEEEPPKEEVKEEIKEEIQDPEKAGKAEKVEEKKEEEQKVGEEKEEEQEPEDINAILREQIVKLTEQLSADPMVQKVKEDVKEVEEPKEKKEQKKEVLQSFLSDEEIDRIIDEPQLLNIAFNRAISVMQQNMQAAIQSEVNRQVMVSRAVSDFYTANQDLAPYGKFVQFVMSEVERSNPNETYENIFKITANEARKRLGLSSGKTIERQQSQATQKPAFAGSKKNTAKPTGKQEFFDPNAADMFNLQ